MGDWAALFIFIENSKYLCFNLFQKGGGNIDNSFVLSDPDSPDIHTYTLITTTYSKLFDINPNTGIITYDIDYDVDQGANPSNLTLNVMCTDSFGETGTLRTM